MTKVKTVAKAVLVSVRDWAITPQARRYEIAVAIFLYQAIVEAVKHG